MSSLIDPITGLPYDALDTTLYSIPLDSQPILAPEWNPQGRISSTVHPDNIPTVFATGQAQNELNPKTVQAMTMDGAGNLNVNVKAQTGGGGGATAIKPTASYFGFGNVINALNGDSIGGFVHPTPTKLVWSYSGALNVDHDNAPSEIQDSAWLGFIDTSTGTVLMVLAFDLSYSTYGGAFYALPGGHQTMLFPNGLDLSGIFGASTHVQLAAGGTNLKLNCSAIVMQ